jgi:hypothetical protein
LRAARRSPRRTTTGGTAVGRMSSDSSVTLAGMALI